MKKLLITVLILGTLTGLGAAFAQNTATHDLTINIPTLMGVRIVDSSGVATANAGVTFDFVTDPTDYIAAVTGTTPASLPPTSTPNFGNVQVMNNTGTWSLSVMASSLNYVGAGTGGISLADITVTPSAASAPVTSVTTRTLSGTESDVAEGDRTSGWINVGINGDSYSLSVNGDEDPGTYTTTVTYTLSAP